MVFWPSGHPDFWPSGLLAIWSSGLLTIWSSSLLVIWSSDHPTIWLSGHPTILTSGHLAIWSSGLLSWCLKNVLIGIFLTYLLIVGYTNLKFLTSSLMLKNEEYNAATQKSKYGNDKSQVNLWLFFWLFVLKRCLFQLRLSKIWNLLGKSKSQTITKIDSSSIFAILLCY